MIVAIVLLSFTVYILSILLVLFLKENERLQKDSTKYMNYWLCVVRENYALKQERKEN